MKEFLLTIVLISNQIDMFNQIFDRILNSSIFFRFSKKYKLKRQHKKKVNLIKSRAKQKIFVIGFNKTGTTSIEAALKELGYIPADQWHFTLLFDNFFNWVKWQANIK